MDPTLGIDIGGTKANIGLVSEDGTVIASTRLPAGGAASPAELIGRICAAAEEMIAASPVPRGAVTFAGVGVPGTADISSGYVEFCPNLGWEDVPAGELFRERLNMDVVVSQDSRAAAWAEYQLGAGRGFHSFICVTLGTGIGAGVILDGRLFHGAMNTAGELGHTIYVKNGRHCNCGRDGCLERYCSGTGFFERAFEAFPQKFEGQPRNAETVFELANAGDSDMLALIREVVDDLAVGIANAVDILSPQAVILSGGLCVHESLILEPLRELVYHYGYHPWARKKQLRIEKAQLGSDAPMIGAALLYKAV